jgi:hypothetical protein
MIAAPLIAAVLLGSPASVGVGIGGAPVCPAAAVQPGTSVSLGTIYIVNTGSGSENITLHAAFPANGLPGRAFPGSWVTFRYPKTLWLFGGSSVTLGPGQGADIPATLNVPAGTKPGLYASDLLAGTMAKASPGSGGQAVFGAGAEENLQFAVAPARVPACDAKPAASASMPVTPDGGPTASPQARPASPVPAAQYSPAASQGSAGTKPNGGVVIAILAALAVLVIKFIGGR